MSESAFHSSRPARGRADPVAAARLLDREPPAGYRAEWTEYLARPAKKADVTTDSALVFRVANEWLGLPTSWVSEIAPPRPVHSLPHRRAGSLAGLVNVRGELLPCVQLETLFGLGAPAAAPSTRRLCVGGPASRRLVLLVDEVHGLLRYDAAKRLPTPAQLPHVRHLLAWKDGRTIGLLDAEALWGALERGLA